MFDIEYKRCTRQCAATGRELSAGETIYSALVQEGGQIVRLDYAEDQWQGAPEGTLSFWRSSIPDANTAKQHWAPNDVMLHYFEQLAENQQQQDVRYVLGLLMIRRRILRHEDTEPDQSGNETMVLHCPRNEKDYRLTVVHPDQSRVEQIQEELAKFLQSDS